MNAASFDPYRWLQENVEVAGKPSPPPNPPNPPNRAAAVVLEAPGLGDLGGLGGVWLCAATSHSDAQHIAAEPSLPEPGTPARTLLDERQARMLAGLLKGFQQHQTGKRNSDGV